MKLDESYTSTVFDLSLIEPFMLIQMFKNIIFNHMFLVLKRSVIDRVVMSISYVCCGGEIKQHNSEKKFGVQGID